jgi:cyclic pyranopterin phosphate synthase
MCKAIERGIEISDVHLVKKSGGRSGLYVRSGNFAKKLAKKK